MRRAAAVTAVSLGALAITFAVASYLHLRNLTVASPPADVSRVLNFPILSAGMFDAKTPTVIDVAEFARSLSFRIYATGAAGLVLMLIGGCLFPDPRADPRADPRGQSPQT